MGGKIHGQKGKQNVYKIENDGVIYSVVPFFKKLKGRGKIDPKKYFWSTNKATNRGTVTREEYYASGKWNEVSGATCTLIPNPPNVWVNDSKEILMTSSFANESAEYECFTTGKWNAISGKLNGVPSSPESTRILVEPGKQFDSEEILMTSTSKSELSAELESSIYPDRATFEHEYTASSLIPNLPKELIDPKSPVNLKIPNPPRAWIKPKNSECSMIPKPPKEWLRSKNPENSKFPDPPKAWIEQEIIFDPEEFLMTSTDSGCGCSICIDSINDSGNDVTDDVDNTENEPVDSAQEGGNESEILSNADNEYYRWLWSDPLYLYDNELVLRDKTLILDMGRKYWERYFSTYRISGNDSQIE